MGLARNTKCWLNNKAGFMKQPTKSQKESNKSNSCTGVRAGICSDSKELKYQNNLGHYLISSLNTYSNSNRHYLISKYRNRDK